MIMLIHTKHSSAQSPAYDANWVKNTTLSDEFSGTSLDASKWCAIDLWTGSPPCNCCTWGGNSRFKAANTSVGSDGSQNVLILRVDAPFAGSTIPYDVTECCNTGGIQSNGESYTYGYLEMYAKFPGFVDGNGVGHSYKFWPAFWTYHQELTGPCSTWVHDEIDIVDPGGVLYSDAKTYGGGVGNEDGNCSTYGVTYQYQSSSHLCNGYHKYGVEWNSDRMIFYFDDVPVSARYNAPMFIMDPQRLVIDQQIDILATNGFDAGITFPQYMKVDYFRYYTLIQSGSGCSTSATILNNTDLANYTWGVKSDITFGNGSGTISLSSGDNKTFRASNSITINGEFTVPLGAEFTAVSTPCN